MKKYLLTTISLVFGFITLISPQKVLAQINTTTCGSNDSGINTAIGCVPIMSSNGTVFASFIIKWALGVGGGIAFLLILYSGFMIMTSTGNPERLKAGQELLGAAISGIVLMIFSVFILRVIGVNILGIFV